VSVRYSDRRRARRGATLVEFASVAFTLLLVMFAGLEVDRMLFVYTNLADATKAGIRYAITHGNDRTSEVSGPADNPAAVVDLIRYYVTGIDKSTLTITVTYTDVDGDGVANGAGDTVRAVVQYPYTPWVLLPFHATLSSTSTGRITF